MRDKKAVFLSNLKTLDIICIVCSKAFDNVYYNILVFVLGQRSLGWWMSKTLWMVMLMVVHCLKVNNKGHSKGSALVLFSFTSLSVIERRRWRACLSGLQMMQNSGDSSSTRYACFPRLFLLIFERLVNKEYKIFMSMSSRHHSVEMQASGD